jgi:uroporphyrinogen-III synthase
MGDHTNEEGEHDAMGVEREHPDPSAKARPLAGRRVLVTRARAQAGSLTAALRAAGAEPVEAPLLRIDPAGDYAMLDEALRHLRRYDWTIFTSANTIVHVGRRLEALGLGWTAFAGVAVAAVGPKSAEELRARGVDVAYVPAEAVGSVLAAGLPLLLGQRVLFAGADIAATHVAAALRNRGAVVDQVVAYRTTPVHDGAGELRAHLASGAIDAVTFASSSSVHNLCAVLGDAPVAALARTVLACIGPVTATTARAYGLAPRVVAGEHTVEGLVAALSAFFASVRTTTEH